VIVVATVAAWTGGYVGYRLGLRAGDAVADRPGPLRHQRRRAMISGERIYRRWGRLAVFLTPTFISGAMKMPHRTFLIWNALAAIASTCVAALGAYGIGAALLGQLSAKRGVFALAVAALTFAALLALIRRRRYANRISRSRPRTPPHGDF
jgi:membrane-associated protein